MNDFTCLMYFVRASTSAYIALMSGFRFMIRSLVIAPMASAALNRKLLFSWWDCSNIVNKVYKMLFHLNTKQFFCKLKRAFRNKTFKHNFCNKSNNKSTFWCMDIWNIIQIKSIHLWLDFLIWRRNHSPVGPLIRQCIVKLLGKSQLIVDPVQSGFEILKFIFKLAEYWRVVIVKVDVASNLLNLRIHLFNFVTELFDFVHQHAGFNPAK